MPPIVGGPAEQSRCCVLGACYLFQCLGLKLDVCTRVVALGSRRMLATMLAGTSKNLISGVSGVRVEDGVAGERRGEACDEAAYQPARALATGRIHELTMQSMDTLPQVRVTSVAERIASECGKNWTRQRPKASRRHCGVDASASAVV